MVRMRRDTPCTTWWCTTNSKPVSDTDVDPRVANDARVLRLSSRARFDYGSQAWGRAPASGTENPFAARSTDGKMSMTRSTLVSLRL
jgi:hypothetical protein